MPYRVVYSKFFLLLICLTGCAVSGPAASSDTLQFMKSRDAVLQKFQHKSDCRQGEIFNWKALKDDHDEAIQSLGKQLRELIGDVHIRGTKGKGRYTRTTLLPSACDHGFEFSRTDGMMYSGQYGRLFITIKALQQFVSVAAIFSPDAAWQNYMDIPLKPRDSTVSIHAALGQFAQDSGPFPPTVAIVKIEKGKYSLVYEYDENGMLEDGFEQIPLGQIPFCKGKYSNIFNSKDASNQMEADRVYRTCYSNHIKNSDQYKMLVKNLQTLADHLQRGLPDHAVDKYNQ